MHIYLGMLVFEGDTRTSLVVIVQSKMPRLYPLYQVLGLMKNVYKVSKPYMLLYKSSPANCNFGRLS
jgi:hypothetical protein